MAKSCLHSFNYNDHVFAPHPNNSEVLVCGLCGAIFNPEDASWLRN